MGLRDYIEQNTAELLEGSELFLVEILSSKEKTGKITVVIDGDNGVNIDDCSSLSRRLGKLLDENGEFDQSFVLDVTSPGLENPLKLLRQYVKNIGRDVKVTTIAQEVYKGKLKSASEEEVVILEPKTRKKEEREITVPFDEIKSTKVQVSFK